MATVFAGVSGGYSANLLISTLDPLLAGITQEAARLIDPAYTVHAAVNWYFMSASTFLVTALGWWVSVRIVEPNLGSYEMGQGDATHEESKNYLAPLTDAEKKGLRSALLVTILLLGIFAALILPESGILREPGTGTVLQSPFLRGIVTAIFLFFLLPSIAYGWTTGKFGSDKDVIDGMSHAMRSLSLYIVLVFFAAQFVAYFNWSNLGVISAVAGAEFLKGIGFTGIAIFVPLYIT